MLLEKPDMINIEDKHNVSCDGCQSHRIQDDRY